MASICVGVLLTSVLFILQSCASQQTVGLSGAFHQWQKLGLPPVNTTITLHIGLRRSSEAVKSLHDKASDIADPSSPQYRQHLSAEQLRLFSLPETQSILLVRNWLQDHGIVSVLKGDFFEATASVSQANDLLKASYHTYACGAEHVVRTESFSLPDAVAVLVDIITPTNHFPRPINDTDEKLNELKKRRLEQNELKFRDDDDCSTFITPACIRRVYNITYTPAPNRTTFAVYGTEAATLNSGDLEIFLDRYNKPAASAHAQFIQVGSGDPATGFPGIGSVFETALDTQTSLGTAWPAQGIFYNNGGVFGPDVTRGRTYDRFVSFLQELVHNETVPSVVSFSESMPENQMDEAYARRLCDMMAQIGMRGVSLLFSSGDNGPSGDQPTGKHDRTLETDFPASCPFVTAVGGTVNPENETAATKETMNGGGLGYWASGGGFSTLFARLAYQDEAVSPYVQRHIPKSYYSKPGFNASGRGVPDIAAFSAKLPTVVLGLTVPVGGTSASTPLWAAIVTLLNNYEAARGRPPMGFLNPWLYGKGSSGLKDIATGGDNTGACLFLAGCTLTELLGYNVTTGWDPVTGLGSPNVGKLIELL